MTSPNPVRDYPPRGAICSRCRLRIDADRCEEPVSDACTGPYAPRDAYHPEYCAVCPVCGYHGDAWRP